MGDQGGHADKDGPVNSIPKPKGTEGKDYSIQVEMGLSGSKKKHEKYTAIQVSYTRSREVQIDIPVCSTTSGTCS